MEESEKRKERLKAMRMEAAQGGVIAHHGGSLGSHGLTNPLVQSESLPTPFQQSSRRFDFYTDPMAAFSGRKESNVYPVPQQHYNAPRPLYQGMIQNPLYQGMIQNPLYHNPSNHSPGSRMFRGPGAHSSQSYLGSPMEATPFERMPQVPGTHSNQSYLGSPLEVTPGGRMIQVPGAHSSQSYLESPMETTNSWVRPQGNPPGAWPGAGGALNYEAPTNPSQRGNFMRPSFGQGEPPHTTYGRGRGQRYNTSSHHDSGRGRAQQPSINSSPGSGPSGRRTTSSHHPVSAKERPDWYYSKKMIEDPWKQLTPALWEGPPSRSDKFWLPNSLTKKKAKVTPEVSKALISQPSLAQYLAEAFNDPINEAVDDSKCST